VLTAQLARLAHRDRKAILAQLDLKVHREMLALRVHRATLDHRVLKEIKVHRAIRVQLAQRDLWVLPEPMEQQAQKVIKAIRD